MRFSAPVTMLAVLLFALSGCGKDTNAIPDQREAIIKYLDTKMAEYERYGREVTYREQGGVFLYVPNMDRAGYPTAAVAAQGDSVWFRFAAFEFTSSPQNLYYTDIPDLLAGDTILNARYWPSGPQKVKIGTTPLIRGLTNALPGSRPGDSLMVFISSDLGYGDKAMGIVPSSTTLMYMLQIENVKK